MQALTITIPMQALVQWHRSTAKLKWCHRIESRLRRIASKRLESSRSARFPGACQKRSDTWLRSRPVAGADAAGASPTIPPPDGSCRSASVSQSRFDVLLTWVGRCLRQRRAFGARRKFVLNRGFLEKLTWDTRATGCTVPFSKNRLQNSQTHAQRAVPYPSRKTNHRR